MKEIFNLENYKRRLIEFYAYEMDNNDIARNKRKEQLAIFYSDQFLQSVIDDTLNFSIYLLESNLSNETCWYDIDLLEDAHYVFLNLTGGWFSDVLYKVNLNGKDITISRYLLNRFLGKDFHIQEDSNCEAVVDEDDSCTVCAEYSYPFLRIVGNFQTLHSKLDEIKLMKQTELVLALKK